VSTDVERLALGCLMPGFEGTSAPAWVLRRAAEGLGAVALFGRNVIDDEQVGRLTASLHAERRDLVVAIDEEGGDVTRLDARVGSRYPGNLALGVAGDVDLTREVASVMGRRLAAAGVDLDLAPVADVNVDAMNPIIGVRSFGSDFGAVSRHVAAWIEGMQGAGVVACAKHFPGHGDTAVDSHLALPVAGDDPGLRALRPFEAAIEAGAGAIMSAHIVVRALDDAPATVSRRIMTGLLRDRMGFRGVAITDGLEMRALTGGRDLAGAAVEALAAGCDVLLVGGGLAGEDVVDDLVGGIATAVAQGRLDEPRLAEAASRVAKLPSSKGSSAGWPRESAPLEAALLALRVEGDVCVGRDAVVVRFGSPSSIAAGEVPWGMAAALRVRGVEVTEADAGVPGKSLVIAVRDLHRDASQRLRLDELLAARPDAVVVEMGVPACRPNAARNYIATNGSARVCADAAARVMRPD